MRLRQNTAALQVHTHGFSATVGEVEVGLRLAFGGRVADDVDRGLRIEVQRLGDLAEHRRELCVERRRALREGHVGRHHGDDAIALALQADAAAGDLAAHVFFLAVHVAADTRACEHAHSSANRSVAAVIATSEHAADAAHDRANGEKRRGQYYPKWMLPLPGL